MIDLTPPQIVLLMDVVEFGSIPESWGPKAAKVLMAKGLARNGGPNRDGKRILEATQAGRDWIEKWKTKRI
jgi:hypothetical protein